MTFQQFSKDYGVLTLFVLQWAVAGIVWWRRKELASKSDVARLEQGIGSVRAEVRAVEQKFEQRCGLIEAAASSAPSSEDINNLRVEMERVRGDIRAFTERADGAKQTFNAQVETVQAQVTAVRDLVERGERMVETLTRHMLDNGR